MIPRRSGCVITMKIRTPMIDLIASKEARWRRPWPAITPCIAKTTAAMRAGVSFAIMELSTVSLPSENSRGPVFLNTMLSDKDKGNSVIAVSNHQFRIGKPDAYADDQFQEAFDKQLHDHEAVCDRERSIVIETLSPKRDRLPESLAFASTR